MKDAFFSRFSKKNSFSIKMPYLFVFETKKNVFETKKNVFETKKNVFETQKYLIKMLKISFYTKVNTVLGLFYVK